MSQMCNRMVNLCQFRNKMIKHIVSQLSWRILAFADRIMYFTYILTCLNWWGLAYNYRGMDSPVPSHGMGVTFGYSVPFGYYRPT